MSFKNLIPIDGSDSVHVLLTQYAHSHWSIYRPVVSASLHMQRVIPVINAPQIFFHLINATCAFNSLDTEREARGARERDLILYNYPIRF